MSQRKSPLVTPKPSQVINSATQSPTSRCFSSSSTPQSLIKRAVKVLYPSQGRTTRLNPHFILGLAIYRGFLGYAVLEWLDRATKNVGAIPLLQSNKRNKDLNALVLSVRDTLSKLKASLEDVKEKNEAIVDCSERRVETLSSLDGNESVRWSVGLSDGLQFVSKNSNADGRQFS